MLKGEWGCRFRTNCPVPVKLNRDLLIGRLAKGVVNSIAVLFLCAPQVLHITRQNGTDES
jgi:hypothetical protein